MRRKIALADLPDTRAPQDSPYGVFTAGIALFPELQGLPWSGIKDRVSLRLLEG